MELLKKEDNGLNIVKVEGRLDTVTASNFEKECLDWLEQGKNSLVLDFSALEYISSAGLRSILLVGKKAKANNGSLAICGMSGLVQEVFTISGFDNFFPIYASVGDLLKESSHDD